ncbi:LacI family DNA-binding transcriptional regulator [Paenarthrobacter nicotinovorans]|uniref:LacI family DNA-binding transcriptional regulator n=1 Tax=Paenarthrobacter nicotinovorans TaxID=29320 RepID=UPI0016680096|nr:LacI family DNA-binding transcriptional regulator [Paenarthrobacter nicotinovorans]MBP2393813.1 DNA-binding LacI/PurR family transcriptional regulator [Paenarthrobacter nicotinovorans]UKE99948.1 LacI family DNA-binding transcriptional regulator [Paenarthrobacter nicotinovorans]UKF04732.1 LacI family DNA-binding transcriptional regulator [Paenarthrobacter nicotinovorans]
MSGITVPRGANGQTGATLRRKPTINDVAEIAGVSFGTVSRVLNNAPDVSAATRERVLQAIKDIGYRRNRAATALVTNRSTSIGLLSDGSPRFGPVGTLMALETVARKKGYATTVISVDKPYDESVQAALDTLDDTGVGGIIVVAPLVDMASAVWNASCRVPVEMIAAGASSTPNVFTYSENQELGARLATQHLIDLGHTDIAHLAGSMDWFDGRVRKRGWEAALGDAGLPPGLCLEGDWSPRWAYETGLRLVREGKVPQAVFAASDHTALGLIRALTENGIRVPEDVSVVGFDDIEGSDYFLPPLTTVRQDFTALAHMSMEVLLGAMEGREVDRTPIAPTLVVRESSTQATRHSGRDT